ncbi:hypothetical protein FA13DRAFT_27697 [Coprinellus micaceus]|uniref:Uncharacterized protein n=1 Tax=Coprinellus micaceus TaxID=71717 RepID=A0A4Y7U049_COPMI|nr:hypothetical protein FA13DRAFT_27697 [Coprinellus micaceus]
MRAMMKTQATIVMRRKRIPMWRTRREGSRAPMVRSRLLLRHIIPLQAYSLTIQEVPLRTHRSSLVRQLRTINKEIYETDEPSWNRPQSPIPERGGSEDYEDEHHIASLPLCPQPY